MVRPDGKTGVRVREAAKPAEFEPTADDLRNVRGLIAREIERLQARLAELDKAIASA